MSRLRLLSASLAALIFLTSSRAAEPLDPLRLAPETSEYAVVVQHPVKIVELLRTVASWKEVLDLRSFQEAINSTDFRQLRQMIGHFEKHLGRPWYELIEPLAGGGIVLAGKVAGPDAGGSLALYAIQGKDPALAQKFLKLVVDFIDQETNRQGLPDMTRTETYKGTEIIHFGDQVHAAVVGAAIVGGYSTAEVKAAIDRHLDGSKKSLLQRDAIIQTRKMLPSDALGWAWVDVQKSQGVKNIIDAFFGEPATRIGFGGLLDVVSRSPCMTFALRNESSGPALSVLVPKGRNGMNEGMAALHVPSPNESGVLPLLRPKGTMYSGSVYFDFKNVWEKRAEVFKPKPDELKNLEQAEKDTAKFLFGTRASQLLSYLGARHRVMVVTPEGLQGPPVLNGAVVLELREPEKFTKAIDAPARALGLLLGFQVKMKLVEEKHRDHKIATYEISPDPKFDKRIPGIGQLSDFSPSYVRVGNYFVLASSKALARVLIDELEQEAKAAKPVADSASMKSWFSWQSLMNLGTYDEDADVTKTVLDDGISLEEAREQVKQLRKFLGKLDAIEAQTRCEAETYRFDIRLRVAGW